MNENDTRPVYLALITQTVISAMTFLAAKQATAEIPPITLTLTRLLLSGTLLTALLFVTKGKRLPPRALLGKLFLLGLLCGPVNQGFFLYGLASSTPAHAALLYALTPIGVYLYLLVQGQERASARRFVGIGIAFVGVVTLLLGRGLKEASGPLFGDVLILIAVMAWVVYSAEGRKLLRTEAPIRVTSWTMTAGAVLGIPLLPFALDVGALSRASPLAWQCLGFIVVFTSVISYLLWYYALSRMTASKVAVFSNLQPVATALVAWGVRGDPLNWEIVVGGALVLLGVRFTQTG